MKMINHMNVRFDAKSVNESLARMTVAAFMMDMNPTLDELEDVKTAVSEAVTNAIIHGYGNHTSKEAWDEIPVVELQCAREGVKLEICIIDHGIGIEDIEKAKQPFYTTKPDMERSGMGFVFMETFMDCLEVESKIGEGTKVTMIKYIAGEREQ